MPDHDLPGRSRPVGFGNRFLLYLELVRMEFVNNLAYRSSYFTGIFNYTIQIGAYFFLWDAIYSGRRAIGGLNKEEMITYVIVAWVARSFYFSNLDRRVAVEIRDGKIALELIRPYSYQMVKYARASGEAFFRILFFAVPAGTAIYFIRPFGLPPDWQAGLLFLLAVTGGFVINSQISMIAGFCAFFTQSTSGIFRAKRVIMDLFSGLLLPISFYPGWARDIIKLFPFQTVSYMPNLIYLGKITGGAVLHVILLQLFWVAFLGLVSVLFWRFAVKHVVIQGG
ncbi:MAG: daunorubicin ABC transporter permease [Firmicutes bacterium HGW-Firmicutes-8]|nr:MAG: daunorubicin ABC transporter permease [Firmicutes bacterium HGW-Firmicutes-8]